MEAQLTPIRKWAATWHKNGQLKSINTDNKELAEKKAILNDGTFWENSRYEAGKRLQRMYCRLFNAGKYDPQKVDYPYLLTIKN